jgi:hypothetical protein
MSDENPTGMIPQTEAGQITRIESKPSSRSVATFSIGREWSARGLNA